MVYQLQRPSIEMIIDYCRDLLAECRKNCHF